MTGKDRKAPCRALITILINEVRQKLRQVKEVTSRALYRK